MDINEIKRQREYTLTFLHEKFSYVEIEIIGSRHFGFQNKSQIFVYVENENVIFFEKGFVKWHELNWEKVVDFFQSEFNFHLKDLKIV